MEGFMENETTSQETPSQPEEDNFINYGSENDLSDTEYVQKPVSRTRRMFPDDYYDDEVVQYVVVNEWPPLPIQPTLPSSTPTLQPTVIVKTDYNLRKFEFDWRPFSSTQPLLEERREKFTGFNGPTKEYSTPYDAFVAIWDRETIEHICTETNKYAQQLVAAMIENGLLCPNSRISKWVDTTPDEMLTYLAICMATGVVLKDTIEEYWSEKEDVFQTPGFAQTMPFDRYQLICQCLHFADNSTINTQSMSKAEIRLHKIKPIIDHLNVRFQKLYSLDQNIAVDQSLTQSMGVLDKNKAAAASIKSHEIREPRSGYLWRFKVHTSPKDDTPTDDPSPISGAVPSLVIELLSGLEGKGHSVWMDTYYNSPALARELKTRGFDCVGTLQTNSQGVPTELAMLKDTDMRKGQVCGCTSGDVDLLIWRDNKCLALVSTYHGPANVRCDDTGLKPTVAYDYYLCMRDVDKKDRMLATYPIERKQIHIWYKWLFRRLLNASVLNAYIMFKHYTPNADHHSFRWDLVDQILQRHGPPTPTQPRIQKSMVLHCPNRRPRNARRKCAVCRKRTHTFCEGCKVSLCVFSDLDCFRTHHLPG